ncbi:MAG: CDP-alcohol phosphatidyltransferase family protein [Alphaproteobacteria bacterium]|nr:CDP-alcohol phosphatidyltransferase family protein [Alphaproteobacteria bacterium]
MISNTITIFRMLLTIPLFALLAFGGGAYGWWPLVLFLGAGLLDMVDGKVARARNETSAFGAMIDLIGDRLLTFAAVLGLMIGGTITGVHVAAGVVLIARDLIVASMNEALPGKLGPRVGTQEKVKIIAAFSALTLLIAPHLFEQQQPIGLGALWIAAALTVATVVGYWLAALKEFAKG